MAIRADHALGDIALPPVVLAALIHGASAALLLALGGYNDLRLSSVTWPWAQGLVALVFGILMGMPWWWAPINLLFAPLARMLLEAPVPPLVYLAGFCILCLTNISALRGRVPLFISSGQATRILLSLLPRHRNFRLLDLGCGTGSVLSALAKSRPDGQYVGVEMAPLSYVLSCVRARKLSAIDVRWGDFWSYELSEYDVVYAYLSPEPMSRLWQKARTEMRPGSLLISNGFIVPGVAPAQAIPVNDRFGSILYVWRM